MNDPSSPYIVDLDAQTVKHKPTGVVMRFEPHPDGGWNGRAEQETIPAGLSPSYLSGLAGRMGDAWAMRQPPKGKS